MNVSWQPGRTLQEIERDVIFAALQFYRNNKVHTAKALGICYKTLNNKLEEYNGTTSLRSENGIHVESPDQDSKEQSVPMSERKEVQTVSSSPGSQSDPHSGTRDERKTESRKSKK